MSPPQKQNNAYRLLFCFIAMILGAIIFNNFYLVISSTTDENLFKDTPSRLYINKSIATIPTPEDGKSKPDSVRIGDLFIPLSLKLNPHRRHKEKTEESISDSTVALQIFRPKEGKSIAVMVRKADIAGEFYDEIPSSVYVVNILSGGASDRAGMKVGDIILSINGRQFKNSFNADLIMRQTRSGKRADYKILRDGELMTLHLVMASFGATLSLLAQFICGLFYFGFGVFLLVSRPGLIGARLLGFAFLATGFVLAVLLVRLVPMQSTFAITRDVLIVAGAYLAFPLFGHAHFHFPLEFQKQTSPLWPRYIPWLLAFSGIFLHVLYSGHRLQLATIIITALLVLASRYGLQIYYGLYLNKQLKKLNHIIFWARLVTTACVILILAYLIPGKMSSFGFISIPLVLLPLAYLYTIGRYRIFELDLRLNKNIQYTIAIIIFGILLAGATSWLLIMIARAHITIPNLHLSATSLELLDTPLTATRQLSSERILFILSGMGIALLFIQFHRLGRNILTKIFEQGSFDYRRAANAIAEVMDKKRTIDELAHGLVAEISETMRLTRASLLIFKNDKVLCFQNGNGANNKKWNIFCDSLGPTLLATFTNFRNDTRFSVEYLQSDLRDKLVSHNIKNIFIIRSKHRMVGVLLIGGKISESPFNREDLTFLTTISRQAAVAFENAFLYEELAGQERLKHELAISRRIQLESLPQKTPAIKNLQIEGTSIPATEVGGDYFDYLNDTIDEITIIVGDVSGKGTSAALYMSKVQGIFRSLHAFKLSPQELFIRANNILTRDLEKQAFVTAIGGHFNINRREISLARAGHLPLYYYNAQKDEVMTIAPKGIGLGLFSDREDLFAHHFEERAFKYQKGDVFLFITDGITEARNKDHEEFGEERVCDFLQSFHEHTAKELQELMVEQINTFAADGIQHDDQTIVVVKAT